MRVVLHLLLASTVGLPALSSAPAQSPPNAPAAIDNRVRLRMAPDLDRKHPGLRAAINASSSATIAEPAEFELNTDDYLPDYAELRPLAASSDLFQARNVIRIGKLSVGEVPTTLSAVTGLMQRQKALAALVTRPVPTMRFCKEFPLTPDKCAEDSLAAAFGETLPSLVSNMGTTPRYIALLRTSASMGIALVPIRGTEAMVRLNPGESLRIPAKEETSRGRLTEYLIVSDSPFDPAPLTQPDPYGNRPECYAILHAECFAPTSPLVVSPDWSALAYTSFASDEPQPAMGGGFAVSRGDADWMVAIYSTLPYTQKDFDDDKKLPPEKRQFLAERSPIERAHSCGGTVIAPNLVLTAAHCVATGRFKRPKVARVLTDRRVRLGSLRLGRGGETRAIVGVAVHAGYTGEGTGLPNDIALLLLKSDESIRLEPRALDLASKSAAAGETLTGLGWGFTKSVAANANILMSSSEGLQHNPSQLQQAPLEAIGSRECKSQIPDKFKPGMICLTTPKAVLERGGRETFSCRGDSGGPLVRNFGGSDELVGLTSFSIGCGNKDTPSVYTDVAYFAKWIAAAKAQIKPGEAIFVAEPARR